MNARLSTFSWRHLSGSTKTAACLLIAIVLAALIGPFLTGHDANIPGPLQFSPPSAEYWCGTDLHGRDLLTRMLNGARISLFVGLIGAGVNLVIGVAYGALAGYLGGKTDHLMMRLVDILYSLPRMLFVIVLIASFEQPVTEMLGKIGFSFLASNARMVLLFIGLGFVEWLTMARIIRGQVLVLKESPFIQASRTLCQSHAQILVRHLLPNLAGIIVVYLTLTIPVVILEEAFLSFLGLGIEAPSASWGSLISDGAQLINPIKIYWWLLAFPAGMMAVTLLSLNFLGDGLRDLFDPRSRK
jgi:oligopeptide transport system permease protein